jgi:hypothetical protein
MSGLSQSLPKETTPGTSPDEASAVTTPTGTSSTIDLESWSTPNPIAAAGFKVRVNVRSNYS